MVIKMSDESVTKLNGVITYLQKLYPTFTMEFIESNYKEENSTVIELLNISMVYNKHRVNHGSNLGVTELYLSKYNQKELNIIFGGALLSYLIPSGWLVK